jgi:hypothetical protein
MKNIIILFTLFSLLTSCDKNRYIELEGSNEFSSRVQDADVDKLIYIELNFEEYGQFFSNVSLSNDGSDIIKISNITNENLKIIKARIQGDDNVYSGIILKEYSIPQDDITTRWITYRGYFFDGHDCFIYGSYYVNEENGDIYFQPAGAATQSLMNQCGYGNMAFKPKDLYND